MGIIDKDMRDVISRCMLSFVATVCPDGSPSVSPKDSVRVFDDNTLVFMDIASPQTVSNLQNDPRVEINSIDFLKRRGYRFKGKAHIELPGTPVFEWLNSWLLKINGPGYPANQVVVVDVERALAVFSPAYFWGNTTEEDLTLAWAERYLEVEGLSTDNLRKY